MNNNNNSVCSITNRSISPNKEDQEKETSRKTYVNTDIGPKHPHTLDTQPNEERVRSNTKPLTTVKKEEEAQENSRCIVF